MDFSQKFEILKEHSPNIELISAENSFDKIRVDSKDLISVLNFVKNTPEFDMDRLSSMIAVDLADSFEVIYDLHSSNTAQSLRISVIMDRKVPKIPSAVDVFKSAYFDECEIFDLFGIDFDKNPKLKRLFMPKGWVGHPLRKDYILDDSRLAWNSGGKCD